MVILTIPFLYFNSRPGFIRNVTNLVTFLIFAFEHESNCRQNTQGILD